VTGIITAPADRRRVVQLPDVVLATISAVLPLGALADTVRQARAGQVVVLRHTDLSEVDRLLTGAIVQPHPIVRTRAACHALRVLREAVDALDADVSWPVPLRLGADTAWLPRAVAYSSREP
jgi:hypothetical protein